MFEASGLKSAMKIKRLSFILGMILLLSTGAAKGQAALLVLIFGERAATENFHFSLKLGVNYSIIQGYDEGNNGWNLNFGLVNNIKLSEKLTLTPEFIALSPRSVRNVPVLTTGDLHLDNLLVQVESTDRKLHYIDIPVLLKYKLTDRFSISVGPQLSILTGAVDTYKSTPQEEVVLITELNIKSALNPIDAGAVLDLHYTVVQPVGGKGVNLYIRYCKGFIGLLKDDNGPRYTTSLIQFGATFPFVQKLDTEN
jgi:hypothetical protein